LNANSVEAFFGFETAHIRVVGNFHDVVGKPPHAQFWAAVVLCGSNSMVRIGDENISSA
jgi:hypothetical protein